MLYKWTENNWFLTKGYENHQNTSKTKVFREEIYHKHEAKIKINFSEVQDTYENFRARCTVDTVKYEGIKNKKSTKKKKSVKKSGSKKLN